MDISNTDDIINSRDVIERIEELRDEWAELQEAVTEAAEDLEDCAPEDEPALQAAYREAQQDADNWDGGNELATLEALAEEASGYASDWHYGEMLIRDSCFEDYAQELAEDIGAIDRNTFWPNNCIDWKEAAEQLQQEYTAVNFDGVTYWVR